MPPTVLRMTTPATRPKYEKCVRPYFLAREETTLSTGEVNISTFEKRCGTRRKDLCEPCSIVWKDDAYFALMTGAKDYQGKITFITLTAPGWRRYGKAHKVTQGDSKFSTCPCKHRHKSDDPLVGLPLDKNNFHHRKVVEFNHLAPRLTAITLQKIWRLMATQNATSIKKVKRPTARVMEWQDRGLLHVHIIVLGEIPEAIVKAAVLGRASQSKSRSVSPTSHKGVRWGTQLDVKHVDGKNLDETRKLSAYVTKVISYAVKDVTRENTASHPGHNAHRQTLRSFTNSVISCSATPLQCRGADLGDNPSRILIGVNSKVGLCRKHYRGKHQLGFTGNVLSLNRSWGSSLGAARKARQTWAKSEAAQTADKAGCLDTEKKLVTHLFLGRDPLKARKLLAIREAARIVSRSGVFTPLLT